MGDKPLNKVYSIWWEKNLKCNSCTFSLKVMLMSALRTFVKNSVKESLYEKKKKKTINILVAFFILIKVMSKLS